MNLQPEELEYLSVWTKEEKTADPYALPAHQLQAVHSVRGVDLIRLIKAWTRAEGRRDEDIVRLCNHPNPSWPWSSEEHLAERLAEMAAITGESHAR